MSRYLLFIVCSSFFLVACSDKSQSPEVAECRGHFPEMLDRLRGLEVEVNAKDVCLDCIKNMVKESGGISDLSRKMTDCSIDGIYNYRVDSLVSSIDKRVDNIVYEIDWLEENKDISRYYEVIKDRIDELKPILREIISSIEVID